MSQARKLTGQVGQLILLSLGTFVALYALFGHRAMETLYHRKSSGIADWLMSRRAITPLQNYVAAADEIAWITVCLALPVALILIALAAKPLETLILFASVGICAIASEAFVRGLFRNVTTTSDNSSYFARRWNETIRKNSWGFREREILLQKPRGAYRIAVVGDSITFGQGIEERDRFTNLVENQLISLRGGAYEVLNFGRPGAETIDHLDVLKHRVLPSNPDFVLLQWYTNDFEGHDKAARPKPFQLIPSDTIAAKLNQRSAFFFLLNRHWMSVQERFRWVRSYEEYMLARFGDPTSPWSISASETLRKFVHISKERASAVGMVLFSVPYHGGSRLDLLTDRVLEICRQQTITCVDLRPAFLPYKDNEKLLWVNHLDAHPSPLANRLVADRLMTTFGDLWLRHQQLPLKRSPGDLANVFEQRNSSVRPTSLQ